MKYLLLVIVMCTISFSETSFAIKQDGKVHDVYDGQIVFLKKRPFSVLYKTSSKNYEEYYTFRYYASLYPLDVRKISEIKHSSGMATGREDYGGYSFLQVCTKKGYSEDWNNLSMHYVYYTDDNDRRMSLYESDDTTITFETTIGTREVYFDDTYDMRKPLEQHTDISELYFLFEYSKVEPDVKCKIVFE